MKSDIHLYTQMFFSIVFNLCSNACDNDNCLQRPKRILPAILNFLLCFSQQAWTAFSSVFANFSTMSWLGQSLDGEKSKCHLVSNAALQSCNTSLGSWVQVVG